jgi:hypothetical protein
MRPFSWKEFSKLYIIWFVLGIVIILIGAATRIEQGFFIACIGAVISFVLGVPVSYIAEWYNSSKNLKQP